jgi:hypothetical protein
MTAQEHVQAYIAELIECFGTEIPTECLPNGLPDDFEPEIPTEYFDDEAF